MKNNKLLNINTARALDLVPPEYPIAWNWFAEKSGTRIDRLPFGKGRPEGMPMPLARQAAIHCPSYAQLPSKGAGKKRYALTVYSVGQKIYRDGNREFLLDGTWTLRYHEQRGSDPNQDYNELLFNCLHDGVPLGVMVQSPEGGYDVLGLAVVEEYQSASHVFVLHGPVEFSAVARGGLEDKPQTAAAKSQSNQTASVPSSAFGASFSAGLDDETYTQFKAKVYDAYEGACAITDYAIPEILDAAFIEPYRDYSSLVVSNGILLRADVCRLFDANLLAIAPGTHVISASKRLAGSGYTRLNGCKMRIPMDRACCPDDTLLRKRYRRFCVREDGL